MHSTLNLKETDDPHDGPAIAPDVVPAAWADRVLADIKRDAVSGATGKKLDTGPSVAAGAAAPSVDTTFRATAVNKVQVSGDRPSSGSWTSRAVMAFMFALCSALAAAAWQHYGHTAKQMIADWTPPFVLAASPASEKTGLTEQPGSPAVPASAADQTTPQPAAAAQLPDGASLSRTDAVTRRISDIVQTTPGAANAVAFAGFSAATFTNATNVLAANTSDDTTGVDVSQTPTAAECCLQCLRMLINS